MVRYQNGESGVQFYDCGDDFIRIQFADGTVYLYTYGSAGSSNIEEMKRLAQIGKGLNTFINKNVRGNFAKRER